MSTISQLALQNFQISYGSTLWCFSKAMLCTSTNSIENCFGLFWCSHGLLYHQEMSKHSQDGHCLDITCKNILSHSLPLAIIQCLQESVEVICLMSIFVFCTNQSKVPLKKWILKNLQQNRKIVLCPFDKEVRGKEWNSKAVV